MSAIDLTDNNMAAMNIWRLMGGTVDADNLSMWASYYQISDIELLMDSIMYIRGRNG